MLWILDFIKSKSFENMLDHLKIFILEAIEDESEQEMVPCHAIEWMKFVIKKSRLALKNGETSVQLIQTIKSEWQNRLKISNNIKFE
ncbi:hypothetical protein [Candidatus Protochlamydia amoebophila]|uniref:hypothetical protein n=1 Tax=Candidatus Protochlamydia amoebophila TaxID=362787 RepID=UPI001BC9AB3E|nr:hypothetical protein [Candidatus Protochlamydia amoebophila]